ncbi:Protein of uncharacterized function, DUF OS=Afipia felis OX=1035 GN=BN961_02645 PE=4 SV=1 [Afipia felis]
MNIPYLTRRALVFGAAAAAVGAPVRGAAAAPLIVVNKDPSCGCCSSWVEHLRGAGFGTQVRESSDLGPLKRRLGIPAILESCHTAEIDGFVIEGHVPASAIRRLLTERPAAIGLAVPGMPIGSPGMEVPGTPDETYEVFLFGPAGQRVFARYRGIREIKN